MPRSLLALVALTLALVAGGCDDEPEPTTADPTTEATTEPTSEPPTSEPPTRCVPPSQEPSEEPTVESTADETATAWLNALSTAFGSGEFADVDELSGPACATCSDLVDPVRQTYDQGGSYEADPIRVLSVSPQTDPAVVEVEVEFPAGTLTESAGAQPSTFEASQDTLEFTVGTNPAGREIVAAVKFLP